MYASAAGEPIAELVAILYNIVTTKCNIHMYHVRAHTGNPWNELADSLAKHASLAHHTALPLEQITSLCPSLSLEWLWLKETRSPDTQAYPKIVDNKFSDRVPDDHVNHLVSESSDMPEHSTVLNKISIGILQYNACSFIVSVPKGKKHVVQIFANNLRIIRNYLQIIRNY